RSSFLLAATMRFLPLAEASSITFLAPVVVVALSRPVLGERPTRPRIAASIVGFVGILILLRPGSSILHPAVLLLLGAAFCNAFYQMLTRKPLQELPHTTLFYSALVGTVVLCAALPWTIADTSFAATDALLLLLLGAFAGAGHWCLTHAYLTAPASLLTPYTYLQIVWATGFGLIVFGQHPDGWSVVGMAVIALPGLSLALPQRQ